METKRDWRIFISSVFFVLGFSTIFALLGVLLQSVLSGVAYSVQTWLSRLGGVIIILFGLYTLGLIKINILQREFKIHPKLRFKSAYITAFVFGAAFAVGWTPCVGPILGAILTLAVTSPSTSFFLLTSYSIGLGVPFLLVGLFTNQAQALIRKAGKWLDYLNKFFGAFLVLLGVLIFTSQIGRIANFGIITDILMSFSQSTIGASSSLTFGIAFIAGLFSFLSPCVMPLIPAFLSYLATIATKRG